MSIARKLILAVIVGSLLALVPYAWMRFCATEHIVPVSGQVFLDGQPLAGAYIKFMPVPDTGENPLNGNPGSHAVTSRDGTFTLLQIQNDQPGVVTGEHRIMMRTGVPGPGPDGFVNEQVPSSWRSGNHSFHVTWTGTRKAIFHIETIEDELAGKAPSQPAALGLSPPSRTGALSGAAP